jgi:hypothetical protein
MAERNELKTLHPEVQRLAGGLVLDDGHVSWRDKELDEAAKRIGKIKDDDKRMAALVDLVAFAVRLMRMGGGATDAAAQLFGLAERLGGDVEKLKKTASRKR